jgi:hypothetical protein
LSLRVCDTLYSIVARIDEELDVTLGETCDTLQACQSRSTGCFEAQTYLECSEWRRRTRSASLLIVARLRLLVFFGAHRVGYEVNRGGRGSEIKVGTIYVAQESVKSTRSGSEGERMREPKSCLVDATEGASVPLVAILPNSKVCSRRGPVLPTVRRQKCSIQC